MFHTFNQFEGIQGDHSVDIKCEVIENTSLNQRSPSNSTRTFSNTQRRTVSSSPVALRLYSSTGSPSRRTHSQSSSLRQAHSKRDSRKVFDRRTTMTHPFSSRGTPSRMLYSQSDSPGRRSVDNGQRVMQSPPHTLPSPFVQVSHLSPASLSCSHNVLLTLPVSWKHGYRPTSVWFRLGSDIKPVWRRRGHEHSPTLMECCNQTSLLKYTDILGAWCSQYVQYSAKHAIQYSFRRPLQYHSYHGS